MDKRIYLLTAIAFVVGMVELLIGGILDLVSSDLSISLGRAGLLITVFALVFGLSGPVLMFFTRRFDPKKVIFCALLIFIFGDLLTILGQSYGVLIFSRIILAMSGALLTVLCLALAAHIAPPSQRGRAIGWVIMGISASLVLGLPLGVSLGHAFGWRSPFVFNAILAALLVLIAPRYMGSITIPDPAPFSAQLHALKNTQVQFAHLTTFFFLAGHYTLYGFLTPFVISLLHFDGSFITLMYLSYGVAAVIGGGVAGLCTDRFSPRPTLIIAIVLLFICLLLIPSSTHITALFWLMLVLWGILSWSISPPMQSHLIHIAPKTADIQQGLNVTALHLGIAFGSLVGSLVIDLTSIRYNAFVGAFIILLALGCALISLRDPIALSSSRTTS